MNLEATFTRFTGRWVASQSLAGARPGVLPLVPRGVAGEDWLASSTKLAGDAAAAGCTWVKMVSMSEMQGS